MPRAGFSALWRLSAGLGAAQAFGVLGGAFGLLLFSALLGPEGFGQANLLISIAMLGSLAASLNIEAGAIRTLPGLAPKDALEAQKSSRALVLLGSTAMALIWVAASLLGALNWGEALVLSLLVPALALIRVTARQATALGRPAAGTVPRLIARPAGILAGVVAVLWFGLIAEPLILPVAILCASILGICAQQALLRGIVPLGIAVKLPARPEVAMGLALSPSLLMLEYLRAGTLAVAALVLSTADLGVFALALSLAALPGLAVVAVEMATTPALSRAVRSMGDLHGLLSQSAGLRLGGFVALTLGLIVVLPLVRPHLFPDYQGLVPLVLWCLLPALARAVFGNPVLILTLKGEAHKAGKLSLCSALLVALATFGGAHMAGASGAAAGMALGWVTGWFALWIQCQRATGIDASVHVLWVAEGSASPAPLKGAGKNPQPGGTKAAG